MTANEIHMPVGRPVVLKVTSRDVIHSFWVPNLHGKRDLIPGITTAIWLQADRPGVYRGQCAEFCGKQHAHMAFEVVAESDAQFEQWLHAQRQPAPRRTQTRNARGRDVFLTRSASLCHTVRGTPAAGRVGPDLTHVGVARQDRRRHAAEQRRRTLRRGCATRSTIKPGIADAADPPHRWRHAGAVDVPGEPQMNIAREASHRPSRRRIGTARELPPVLEDPRELERTWADEPGVWGWLCSVDHKAIGRRYLATASAMFVLAGILAALMRLQLSRPEESASSARISTTRSSPRTARR